MTTIDTNTQISSEIDSLVNAKLASSNAPGAAVAIVSEGNLVGSGGYGLANVEWQTVMTPSTRFVIASLTKQLTAACTMLLAREGKLSFDMKVNDLMEDLPDHWSGITLKHLITMTSGIPDYENDLPTKADTIAMLQKEYTDRGIVETVTHRPLLFAPGAKYSYSNTGYHLLGMIIKKLTGRPWHLFMKERIFDPLGMNDTFVNDQNEIVLNRSAGYWYRDNHLVNAPWCSLSVCRSAAGGLISTVLDFAKWDAGLYGEQIITSAEREQMWSTTPLNDGTRGAYGMGWVVAERNGHQVIMHGGQRENGFETFYCRWPERKLGVICFVNLYAGPARAICEGVADLFDPVVAG